MGKTLRNRKFPSRPNLHLRTHAGRCLGHPARLFFQGREKEGLSVLLGSPQLTSFLTMVVPQRKREENEWNMTMAKYEEVTDIDVTDRL